MRITKYKEFSAGRAGNGSINLATGALTFVHEDTCSDANILPIDISHVYSSSRASDTTDKDVTYGKGFKLNLQQTLKKNQPNYGNDTKYTYTDADGTKHTFEDRYYYINNNGKRAYVSTLSDITIDVDGKLTYTVGDVKYDIFTQQVAESGLTLQSELKAFNGSKKLETRHEEVVRLSEEILQLDKTIIDLEYNVVQYGKQDKENYQAILNLQKSIEDDSIALEKDNISKYDNLKTMQDELEKLKDKPVPEPKSKDELVRYIESHTLSDQNALMKLRKSLNEKQDLLQDKKNTYEQAERDELKTRYEYLKGIADKEIEKYKNLKENKQDVLAKLTAQIPVNFIIEKDSKTMGFNEDGNLVALFDSYENQAAIVYENGAIIKVVDADNREIVFEYENKSSARGKLVSITDFKGHKTSFIYGTSGDNVPSGTKDYLKKIEYPNGETTEFSYTKESLLSEMLSPSKMGVQLLYNADKKVESIANLTTAKKIDKNGVFDGEKIAENIVDLTYDGQTTIVHDIKNKITESNLFNTDEKLLRVDTTQDDNLIAFTAYGENSIFSTVEHCNFVMTSDDIAGMDIISSTDGSQVTLVGANGMAMEWQADLTKLDLDRSDYLLYGFASSSSAEKTPMRQKTKYYETYSENNSNSTYRRFEYKVLVDYAGKTPAPQPEVYTPIETEDTIQALYLNNNFTELPEGDVSKFFGEFILGYAIIYYPIFGNESFDASSLSNQLYYTAQIYNSSEGKAFGYALWAGETILWCDDLYANENDMTQGWKQAEVDISAWGPIIVRHSEYIHNWGQFLSKDGIFHNGSKTDPNYAKDNQDPDIDEFIAGFDYTVKERQHVAIPVTLRKENGKVKEPKKITVIAQYKQSQGEAVFERPALTKGKVAYAWVDKSGNTVFESFDSEKIAVNDQTGGCSNVKSSVTTDYDDKNLPTEKRTIHTYTTENGASEQTEVKKWFYNPQGSVIEHWNYVEGEELTSGIDITETMYDNRGNAVKSFAYNSLDASTKFYQEQELAEDGRVLADIDETGSHKTYYEYDDVIGKVKTATAPNGGKFSYAHDTNTDEVSAITQSTENGEANVTNRVYTAGYLTELSSGGNTINFEYDQKGRKSAVYLNGTAPYAVYEYQERKEADETDAVAINETATATIAPTDSVSSYTVKAERDKDGNLLKVSEGKNSESLAESTINTYFSSEDKDREGLLKTSEDRISKTKTEYTYNSLKQPTSAIVRDSDTNAVISSETAEYNAYGEVAKRQITSGGYTQEYGYGYKDNFERELERITMPYGLSSARITDANGRLTERVLTLNGEKLGGEYYYFRKHGDHGTNQISSVRYGERKNKEYVIKDGISYAYDSCGNISEVKENGKLSLRYGYDKLNRLIREDNVKLNKTTLFTYDNNGNILSKRETDFCMREAENIIEFKDEKEYTYDALYPDKLMSFGDEGISGYDAIGNPTSYRGKIFTWQKGRQLASVTDAADTLSFSYDANGRRISKSAPGERTKFIYAGNMLIREERCDDNNTLYFGDDLFAGNNFIDGDQIFIDSVNKSVLEYIYGQDGVVGLVCNGAEYYFRRNVQGDVTRVYSLDGELAACYTYDAWGNHKVFDAEGKENTDLGFIGNINPYRYRGYYFAPKRACIIVKVGTMTPKLVDG